MSYAPRSIQSFFIKGLTTVSWSHGTRSQSKYAHNSKTKPLFILRQYVKTKWDWAKCRLILEINQCKYNKVTI